VEPVDQRTREALSASVQQAIEITTKSQEAAARHDAERKAQEAEGLLERQKLKDEIEVLLCPTLFENRPQSLISAIFSVTRPQGSGNFVAPC
jgi:1,6-anhydro-N-acetylmuramate kinase